MWKLETERGSWASLPNYMVSLLKAWYGDYAMKENEYGFQWLPKLGGNESLTVTIERAKKGEVDGLLVFGPKHCRDQPEYRLGTYCHTQPEVARRLRLI